VKVFLKNELTRLFLFVVLCLIIAAILTPSFYTWGKEFSAGDTGDGVLGSIKKSMARGDLARYYNRVLMGVAIILLYPFIRTLKTDRQEIKPPLRVRIDPRWEGWKDMLMGFIYAMGYMGIFFMVAQYLGWVAVDISASPGKALLKAITPAVGASLIEEWLFRGVLFALLMRSLSARATIIGLSFFFALVHFLKPYHGSPEIVDGGAAGAGFQLLAQIGERFIHPEDFIGVFLTLFAVGVILAYARYKTGYLWMSIGLHAGWVFTLKAYLALTNNTGNAHPVLYGSDIREGLVPLLFVCLTGAAVWLYLRTKRSLL
jgi:membrane protease YdiL (CAAX protease family)